MLPVAVLAAVAVVLAVAPQPAAPQEGGSSVPPAPTAPEDPAAARERVQGTRADLAAEIDVLQADEAELRRAVQALDANVRAAEAQLADADRNRARAREEADLAGRQAADAEAWLGIVRQAVARMAVDAYVRPPGETDLNVLDSVDSATDEALKKTFLEGRTGRDTDLLDELRRASTAFDEQVARAEAAEGAAAASAAELEGKLAQLEIARAQQEGLALGVQQRLEARLAEADALASIDAVLAEQIRSQELALVASLALPTPTGTSGGSGGGSGGGGSTTTTVPGSTSTSPPTTTTGSTGSTPPTTSSPTTRPSTTAPPTTTAPTAPPTTRPPTTVTTKPGNGLTIVSVRGIWVNQSIAANLERMLAAAEADGYVLRGGGYRDPASQIALRKAHCGPTEYDIWHKPASQCTPPTAPPGRSMHEQGLAIDFTWNGSVITSRSSPAFKWLAANAAAYGFYNLPSEPWHWSVNGH